MHHRLREQIIQFEDHASRILAGNLIAAFLLVFLLNPVIDKALALTWLSLQVAFNLLRFILTLNFRRIVLQTEDQIHARYQLYYRMIIASGVIWGSSAFLLYPEGPTEFQLMYLLIIVGFTSTAMSLVNLLPRAYPTLLALIFICVFIELFYIANSFSVSTGLVLIVFILFMLSAAQSFRRNLIESIVLRIKLQQQAIRDALTGVYNRRYFMQQLKVEWNRCTRHQQPLTIMLIDIDHFKTINDRFGHQKGDACLMDIARLLDTNIQRTGEFVTRIGGEEFAIVLPNSTTHSAIKLAEKLHNDINLMTFSHDGKTFHISASMGIACTTPKIGVDCERLFMSADEALYSAKDAGRNCYRVANLSCDRQD